MPLVCTRLRGRVAAWWKKLKFTRATQGKSRIHQWVKFVKHLRSEFLPFNYSRTLYQKFQNLRQGNRTVDVYTEEFYQLLARTNLLETNDQLVSRFIGGLRLSFQDVLNLFSPTSVSEAHQRAVLLERQFTRRPSGPFVSPTQRLDRLSTPSDVRPVAGRGSATPTAPRQPVTAAPGSSTRPGACFSCGEFGHRQASCPRVGRGLLVGDDIDEEQQDFPIYDNDDVLPVEHLVGDVGQSLVLRRACLAPKQPVETERRHQLIESTCTINGKICRLIVDSGSCENVIAEDADAVTKFALVTEKHPHPYSLVWLQRGNNVTVDRRVQV